MDCMKKLGCYFLCCLCLVDISLQCSYCDIFQCYNFLSLTLENHELLIVSYHVRMKKFCVHRPEVNCLHYVSLLKWLFGQGFLLLVEITLECWTKSCWRKKTALVSVRIGTLGCLSTYSWRHVPKSTKVLAERN